WVGIRAFSRLAGEMRFNFYGDQIEVKFESRVGSRRIAGCACDTRWPIAATKMATWRNLVRNHQLISFNNLALDHLYPHLIPHPRACSSSRPRLLGPISKRG